MPCTDASRISSRSIQKVTIFPASDVTIEYTVDVVVVGAGGCGLTAGLAAQQGGAGVLVLERDPTPLGSTAMSTGLIPGANTRFQREQGIDDPPALFAQDILAKARGMTDAEIAMALATESAATIEWLVDDFDIPLSLLDSFKYPGHSVLRMHGTPNRTGRELMGSLCNMAERVELDILCDATVTDLIAGDGQQVQGVKFLRPDGSAEVVGCRALVLACCGFGADAQMVKKYMPEIAAGEYFGHSGNRGDAVRWGQALGANLADMTGYQGHGGLAKGRGVPILWPVIMEGGIQVNSSGMRFSDETRGYSEQAVDVLQQPGGFAWMVYDEARHQLMLEFEDYHDAIEANAIVDAGTIAELAGIMKVPAAALEKTINSVEAIRGNGPEDEFGRDFTGTRHFATPYYAVMVTGALFHTQGGLVVDTKGRVLRANGTPLPNLYAGGGAARGVSGPGAWGYLAGNGLLTATTFGRLAGRDAAKLASLQHGR
ncbi:MAG: FAD-dependent oxidoreductase [Gammaproteobacteria bacterium]|nr:FAD-dependent oxidoreductase [Gammaproteobacteria bacterium]